VQTTISQLAHIHNLRHRITRLKLEGEELAKFGPAKHPEQQGIDQYSDQAVEKGEFYNMDPTGRRTGNGAVVAAAQAPSRLQSVPDVQLIVILPLTFVPYLPYCCSV
jgi:hypothetical protein